MGGMRQAGGGAEREQTETGKGIVSVPVVPLTSSPFSHINPPTLDEETKVSSFGGCFQVSSPQQNAVIQLHQQKGFD